MAINRKDIPLAATPEPNFYRAQDSIKKKTIVVPKTREERVDSLRTAREKEKADRMNARAEKEKKSKEFWRKQDSVFADAAQKNGMTVAQYSKYLEKKQKGPDAGLEGMEGTGRKRNNNPAPCKGGVCTGLNKK